MELVLLQVSRATLSSIKKLMNNANNIENADLGVVFGSFKELGALPYMWAKSVVLPEEMPSQTHHN